MKLLTSQSVPQWLVHNQYIITAYRPPNPSFRYCLVTAFRMHNETGNILTHLLAFLMFGILYIYTLQCRKYKNFQTIDELMFGQYFMATFACFTMSTLFHIFQCHSPKAFKLFAKLDYCGITILITSSNIAWIYYGFYESLIHKFIYTFITLLLCIIGITFSLMDSFSNGELQVLRGAVFIMKGLFGIVPFVHFCHNLRVDTDSTISSQIIFKALLLLPVMAVLYITGAILYMAKIPERYAPGVFDLWFHSHQLFHVCTIAAGLIYFYSLSTIANARLNYNIRNVI
ncbi:adiponectin receptor protein-like, partial [Oppia nitens]|uniref:adiponectin receptor protein-like n=1 Tax=Oppia nitens TaxID=1686743 RepID=UPI0023D9AEBD